jgi:predicted RNA binding protein YcfA (HicA-like mRNA interferase family)
MPKFYSSDYIIKVLQRRGFIYISRKGSHVKFHKGKLTVIVPSNRKEVPYGTLKSILRQSNLTEDDLKQK